jgi:hypothetical protein
MMLTPLLPWSHGFFRSYLFMIAVGADGMT